MPAVTLSSAPLLLLALVVSGVHGYSSGAPAGQCNAMMPNHSPNVAQTGMSPFTVTPAKSTFSGGETIMGECLFHWGTTAVNRVFNVHKNYGAY